MNKKIKWDRLSITKWLIVKYSDGNTKYGNVTNEIWLQREKQRIESYGYQCEIKTYKNGRFLYKALYYKNKNKTPDTNINIEEKVLQI